ncbi:MAG: cell division protein SepF [Spiroplasma sp.]
MVAWWRFNNANEKLKTQSLASKEFNPKNYEDVEVIANTLVLQKPVKVDLQNAVVSDRRRIVDFLCGVAYVLNFDVKKIDSNVYEFKLNK